MATATSFLFILAMLLCDFVATLRARIYIAFLRKDKYSEDDVLKLKDMMKASCRFLQLRWKPIAASIAASISTIAAVAASAGTAATINWYTEFRLDY